MMRLAILLFAHGPMGGGQVTALALHPRSALLPRVSAYTRQTFTQPSSYVNHSFVFVTKATLMAGLEEDESRLVPL